MSLLQKSLMKFNCQLCCTATGHLLVSRSTASGRSVQKREQELLVRLFWRDLFERGSRSCWNASSRRSVQKREQKLLARLFWKICLEDGVEVVGKSFLPRSVQKGKQELLALLFWKICIKEGVGVVGTSQLEDLFRRGSGSCWHVYSGRSVQKREQELLARLFWKLTSAAQVNSSLENIHILQLSYFRYLNRQSIEIFNLPFSVVKPLFERRKFFEFRFGYDEVSTIFYGSLLNVGR